jgi:hypothetical protein
MSWNQINSDISVVIDYDVVVRVNANQENSVAEVFATLQDALQSSVSSGDFTRILTTFAAEYSLTLGNVTTVLLSIQEISINIPTLQPSTSATLAALSTPIQEELINYNFIVDSSYGGLASLVLVMMIGVYIQRLRDQYRRFGVATSSIWFAIADTVLTFIGVFSVAMLVIIVWLIDMSVIGFVFYIYFGMQIVVAIAAVVLLYSIRQNSAHQSLSNYLVVIKHDRLTRLISITMFLCVDMFKYLPWYQSSFVQLSIGYPRYWTLLLCLVLTICQATVWVVCSVISFLVYERYRLVILWPLTSSLLKLLVALGQAIYVFVIVNNIQKREVRVYHRQATAAAAAAAAADDDDERVAIDEELQVSMTSAPPSPENNSVECLL